jgi:predicted GNAT family N-acyltransferase
MTLLNLRLSVTRPSAVSHVALSARGIKVVVMIHAIMVRAMCDAYVARRTVSFIFWVPERLFVCQSDRFCLVSGRHIFFSCLLRFTMAVAMNALPTSSRSLTVHLSDNETETYILRGLNESEIATWAEFCASVFSYKASPPPSSYFERHYYNDPDRQASYIRVACWNDEIVSSCRIFCRRISDGSGSVYKAGGIGEVCTLSSHRKRGLSKELLNDCIRIMTEDGFQISFLHSAPAFFPVYRSAGYECSTTKWTLLPIQKETLQQDSATTTTTTSSHAFSIRLADFPKDVDQLRRIHQSFSEERFFGCIVRSKEYWQHYIQNELEDTLYVLENDDNKVLGWLSIRLRGDRLQVREFGMDETKEFAGASCKNQSAFGMLLHHAVKSMTEYECCPLTVAVPTLVLNCILHTWGTSMLDCLMLDHAVSEDDMGWMYKALDKKPLPDFSQQQLIWPSDSF